MNKGYVRSFYVDSDDDVVLTVSNPDGNDVEVLILKAELSKIYCARQGSGEEGPLQTRTPGW